ncbi:MAG: GAF domain-containing sensor histidine kinase [Anaerolineaceae bacterium]|nr:GAF domain-containing sensor histidine kinase [Anaerolineaceae bacterium]
MQDRQMDDYNKTKDALIRELQQLRSQLATLDQPPDSPPDVRQLTALTKAAQSLLGIHDLPSLWRQVETAVKNLLQPDRMALYLYDIESDSLSCPYAFGLSDEYVAYINRTFRLTPGNGLLYNLAPIWAEDVQNDPAFSHMQPHIQSEGFRSLAIFPLINNQGASGGGLALYWDEIRPLDPNSLNTGFTLAHMIALAINTITLFNQTNQTLLREKQLGEISRMLNATPDLPTLLGSIIKMVAELVRADAGLLGLVIERGMMTFYPHNIPNSMNLRPAPRPRGLAWEIVNSCEPIFLTDYPSHPEAMKKWIDVGVTTFMGVPLRAGDRCLGMLALFNLSHSPYQFNQRDLDVMVSVGQQAGIAIQNLRLLAETQQRAAAMAAALNRQAELDMMKNTFTQSVSHELRSPLGIIYGHAELLASESLGPLNDDQRQSSEIIMRRVMMLTNLVDDLTALLAAETQELRREEIDTIMLVYSLLADYRMRAEDLDITLEAEIEEPMPWILGDSTHLRRVFDNLVSNAFKFTPSGGRITLRLKAVGEDVHIEVEDTGEGIPEDKVGRIFERFYQVESGSKRRHKGTGLGLTLVKEIVEAHRGTVSVRSKPGEGTTFTIHIPGFIPK